MSPWRGPAFAWMSWLHQLPDLPRGPEKLAKFSFLGQILGRSPSCFDGDSYSQNKAHEVRCGDGRHPAPYLQTAAVPSGCYLIFYFTEKWGDIRVTFMPKRGLQAILQPPWPLSPLYVTGCPQLLSLGGSQTERRWSQPSVTDSCEQFNLLLFPKRRIL